MKFASSIPLCSALLSARSSKAYREIAHRVVGDTARLDVLTALHEHCMCQKIRLHASLQLQRKGTMVSDSLPYPKNSLSLIVTST